MKLSMQTSRVTGAHKQDWEDLAKNDPLWAISSHAGKKGNKWNRDEFFATGVREIADVLSIARAIGLPKQKKRALDFGCGVGRLTRALAAKFEQAVGVDISAGMISQAKAWTPECRVIELKDFDFPKSSFDFIYTSHVLQHQPSVALARDYIVKMIEALVPGGLLVFQLPCHLPFRNRLQPRRRAYWALRCLGISPEKLLSLGLQPIRMIALSQAEVTHAVEERGARVLHVEQESATSNLYYCGFWDQAG